MDCKKEDDYMKRRREVEEIVAERFELQQKALKIVERLTELQIDEDFFKSCAEFMLPSHYADVVEERSIGKVCGYPLCDKPLGKMPAQKYHISMKSNKVYDMSERKCFCSHFCYKASKYYQAQVPTVPLWSRSKERFDGVKLLTRDNKPHPDRELPPDSLIVRLRVKEEEVDQPPQREEDDYQHQEEDGGGELVEDVSILSLNDSRKQRKRYSEFEREEARRETEAKQSGKTQRKPVSGDRKKEKKEIDRGKDSAEMEAGNEEKVKDCQENSTRGSGICEQDRVPENGNDAKNELRPEGKLKKGDPQGVVMDKAKSVLYEYVTKCLMEWRTLKSVEFLSRSSGESLSEKGRKGTVSGGDSSVTGDNSKLDDSETKLSKNSQEIESRLGVTVARGDRGETDPGFPKEKKKLSSSEAAGPASDSGDGKQETSNEVVSRSRVENVDTSRLEAGCEDLDNRGGVVSFAGTKPPPDMDELRQQTERFNLKVRQFYSVRPDKLLPSEKGKKDEKRKPLSKHAKADEDKGPVALPPVDSYSQMAIRRKILLDKVHRVFRDLLPPLGITLPDISTDLRDLVMTFDLHSHNITFKPAGWTLVALCLLHLLAHHQSGLHGKLRAPGAVQFLTVLWKQYGITSQNVTGLVDRFVQTYCQSATG